MLVPPGTSIPPAAPPQPPYAPGVVVQAGMYTQQTTDCATWQCRGVDAFTGSSTSLFAVMRINPFTRAPSMSRAGLAGHAA